MCQIGKSEMAAIDFGPTTWLVGCMNAIGIFEAKTKFTAICEEVARSGRAVVVSKRGKPLVMVTPVPVALQSGRSDILTSWRDWKRTKEAGKEDFPDVSRLRAGTKSNPLAE